MSIRGSMFARPNTRPANDIRIQRWAVRDSGSAEFALSQNTDHQGPNRDPAQHRSEARRWSAQKQSRAGCRWFVTIEKQARHVPAPFLPDRRRTIAVTIAIQPEPAT